MNMDAYLQGAFRKKNPENYIFTEWQHRVAKTKSAGHNFRMLTERLQIV